jgi:pimeloyl-ACP methyl ester carboxylesterase
VVSPDYPGFGNTDLPDAAEWAYTFDHLADVVEDLLIKTGFTGPPAHRRSPAHQPRSGGPGRRGRLGWCGSPQHSTPNRTAGARSIPAGGPVRRPWPLLAPSPPGRDLPGKLIRYSCGDCINDYEGISSYEQYRDDLRLLYFASILPSTGELAGLRMVAMQARKMRLHHARPADSRWLAMVLGQISRRYRPRIDLESGGTLILRP